jgi:hypothetical protein
VLKAASLGHRAVEPFHRCTHTAMSPQGDIYVSDGYGNSRVHKYAPNDEARAAYRHMASGAHFGKIVIRVA